MIEAEQMVKRLTGEYMIYPGHPLVVATIIVSVFDTYEEAACPTPSEWCQALVDQRVPGSGCHVSAAMNALKSIHDGASLEEGIERMKVYWTSGKAGGHLGNVEAGVKQAEAIESTFRELATGWFERSAAVEEQSL